MANPAPLDGKEDEVKSNLALSSHDTGIKACPADCCSDLF